MDRSERVFVVTGRQVTNFGGLLPYNCTYALLKRVNKDSSRGMWFLNTKNDMLEPGTTLRDYEFERLQTECKNNTNLYRFINKATGSEEKIFIGSLFHMDMGGLEKSLVNEVTTQNIKGFLSVKDSIHHVVIKESGNSVVVRLEWEDKKKIHSMEKSYTFKDIVNSPALVKGKPLLEKSLVILYNLYLVIDGFNKLNIEPTVVDIMILKGTILQVVYTV